MTNGRRGWLIAMGIAGILGVAVRVFNAFAYPIDMGHDAGGNGDYIALLIRSWTLPAPETGGSTAHPPFFYFAATMRRASGAVEKPATVHAVRLAMAAFGLVPTIKFVIGAARGARRLSRTVRGPGVGLILLVIMTYPGLLAALAKVTFAYGVMFVKHEMSGIQWVPVEV